MSVKVLCKGWPYTYFEYIYQWEKEHNGKSQRVWHQALFRACTREHVSHGLLSETGNIESEFLTNIWISAIPLTGYMTLLCYLISLSLTHLICDVGVIDLTS